jgi:hypothetical protein
MALEDMNTIYVPFVGEVEVDSATGAGMLMVSLVAGTAVYSIAQGAGNNVADWASSKVGDFTGVNPQTGDSGPAGEGGV